MGQVSDPINALDDHGAMAQTSESLTEARARAGVRGRQGAYNPDVFAGPRQTGAATVPDGLATQRAARMGAGSGTVGASRCVENARLRLLV